MDTPKIGEIWTFDDFVVEIITREQADRLGYQHKTGNVLYLYKTGPVGKVGSFQEVHNFLKQWTRRD
jgi:hypothetical protein